MHIKLQQYPALSQPLMWFVVFTEFCDLGIYLGLGIKLKILSVWIFFFLKVFGFDKDRTTYATHMT